MQNCGNTCVMLTLAIVLYLGNGGNILSYTHLYSIRRIYTYWEKQHNWMYIAF